jgi:TRAP-type mannitol/chloroaromatic compound transport system permease small subunit
MLLPRYVLLRIVLLIALVAASFATGMVVMEASSKTGNHPLYFALALLVATGALLLAALLSYRVVVEKVVVGIVGSSRRMRGSRLNTNP